MLSNRSFLLRQALLLTLSMIGLLYVFPVGGSLDQAFIQPWVDLHGIAKYQINHYSNL